MCIRDRDTLRIRRFVEEQKPKTAVLAGGGFIGLEMAENLAEMGIAVTIVQRPKQLLAPLDADMASFVHAEVRRHGVVLRLGETVTGFRQDGDSVLTLLEGSEPLHSDMVLLAIGVTPDTHLAKEAGLKLGIRGSIAVNEQMETSVPDIYAVGDAVEAVSYTHLKIKDREIDKRYLCIVHGTPRPASGRLEGQLFKDCLLYTSISA